MIRSTRRSFVLAGSCVAASLFSPVRATSAGGDTAHVDGSADLRPLIDRERAHILETMTKEDIPGAAICVVYDGKPAWIEGFGVTDHTSKRRVGPDTIFSIQSTSKNMTATAVMLAVQRGLLDLDKPITAYLPDFTVNSRFEARPQDKITLRHLLSNRAGFTHEAPIGNNGDPSFPSFDAHVRSISQTWLRFPVGDRFRYSNLGFDLAGYILQTLMKKPFADCLKTMLFDPIGMNGATADTEAYVQHANRAIGHQAGHETVPLRIPMIPSAGVYASARDLAAYLVFHLNRGNIGRSAHLERKLWDEMHSFAFPGAYSLGVAGGRLRFEETDMWLLTHSGGGFGFGCVFRFYPQAGLGIAAIFNRQIGSAYQWGSALTDEILTRRFGKRNPRTRIEDFSSTPLSGAELQKFVGNWRASEFTRDFSVKDGMLVMRRGEGEVPVRTVSPVEIAIPAEGPPRDAVAMRYFPVRDGAMPHLESAFGDGHLDYNDGPNDAPGPDRNEWDAYLGEYWVHYWSKRAYSVRIHRKNGYLYLNEIRLVTEFKPGLFFTSDGEAVDFRDAVPKWRNVPLWRG